MKFCSVLFLIAALVSSCHDAQLQQIRPNQKEDHDTLESIKKSNLAIIQGSWLVERDGKTVYLEILDSEYNAIVMNGDSLELSDHGRTYHSWPGTVRLFSSVAGCSADQGQNLYLNFKLNELGDVVSHDKDRPSIALARTQKLTELPPANLCLWNYEGKKGGLLSDTPSNPLLEN